MVITDEQTKNSVGFEELAEIIFSELKPKLETNEGLSIFARERSKFEGWLKVELCESLSKYFNKNGIVPEKYRIDITFRDWVIELKTVNTNYRYSNLPEKHRPITKNIQEVIADIESLKKTDYKNKAVLFIVFPVNHKNIKWKNLLKRISDNLREIKDISFNFIGDIPGVIYFGLI